MRLVINTCSGIEFAMGLGGILILLLLIVSLIVFIYIIVMTARSWGILHTILLCTLFIECWVFMVFSAGVQSLRVAHTRAAAKAIKDAEDAAKETQRLLYGSFDTSEGSLVAVVPVKGMLRRLTADRGRVWRQLIMQQENNGEYLLQMTGQEDPAADPLDGGAATAAPATSESLPANLVVYGFVEEQSEQGYPKPVFYLGEFVVTQSQAGQVSLRPTVPLGDTQIQRIKSGEAASWMLYELLPIDNHNAFAAEGSQSSAEAIFGRMDEAEINLLLAALPEGGTLRGKIIDSYLRDGLRASTDDEPGAVWVQVNMLKNHQVDVDSQEEANATVGGYFDTIGRSVDLRLKREDKLPVELTPDMNRKLIVLKEESANELIASGKAELVQRIYVRPLNDYEEAFSRNFIRKHELAERITLVKRESAEVSKANELGNEMIGMRQVENQKLASDLNNYKKEIEVLTQETAEADQELASLKQRMSATYRDILAERAQLGP